MKPVLCPKCGGSEFELLQDEVDIGVGVQAFIIGGECSVCGQMAICASCGAWEHEPHRSWCEHD